MSKLFAFFLLAFAAALPAAQPRVHSIPVFQTLDVPFGEDYPPYITQDVAIDGDSIIALIDKSHEETPVTRVALLYRRGNDGRWALTQTLGQVTAPLADLRAELAMRNNIAVFKIHRDGASIWERIGGSWVQATVTGGLNEPGGFAISQSRILAGASGCDNDGVIYEKSGSGAWLITGRIPPDAGVCANQPRAVELNYDFAYIRHSPSLVRSYRKSGSALVWAAKPSINIPSQAQPFDGPVAVQLRTAVVPGSAYFTRDTTWTYAGQLKAVDYAMGTGDSRTVVYRDGVVLTGERWDDLDYNIAPYLYVPNASGGFDHVGILRDVGRNTVDSDISGRTIVMAMASDGLLPGPARVYVLPESLVAPPAIANNFDARNVSGFTLTPGSGFTLLGNSSNYYFRQTVASRDGAAVYNDTDWSFYQGIEADVTPSSWDLSTSYSGVAVRYVDDNNFYFAGIKSNGNLVLGRKLNGATTILAQRALSVAPLAVHHIRLSISGSKLYADVGDNQMWLTAEDASLAHGSAALVTHRARANFDNTYVKPTAQQTLVWQQYPFHIGRPLTYNGGNWHDVESGLQQSDTSGNAFAIVPNPAVDDQVVRATARLDSWGSTNPVAWFGVVARYVDSRNFYYLSVRSNNLLQIRKAVNGVVTVLKSVTLTIQPGIDHRYVLEVRGNELSAAVDGIVLARALDDSFTTGQYGLATYRAAATFSEVDVGQP
jgi:hypothetical protein